MKTRQILKHTVLACLLLPMGLQAQPHHTTMNISLFGHSKSVRGLHVGLFSATAKEQMYGVQIGGVTNAAGRVRGVQIAGITNIAHEANGLQVASLTNACTSPMRGIQLSGITNIAMGVKRGVQFSGVANICSSSMRGVQAAMYNYSDTLSGSQFGFINVCDHHQPANLPFPHTTGLHYLLYTVLSPLQWLPLLVRKSETFLPVYTNRHKSVLLAL